MGERSDAGVVGIQAEDRKWHSISISRTFMGRISTWTSLWCTPSGEESEASLLVSKMFAKNAITPARHGRRLVLLQQRPAEHALLRDASAAGVVGRICRCAATVA